VSAHMARSSSCAAPVVTVCSSAGSNAWRRCAASPIYLQSPPDLHETSKLAHPVITDHLFLSERHTRTLERYDREELEPRN
jgi:hypothetical protein